MGDGGEAREKRRGRRGTRRARGRPRAGTVSSGPPPFSLSLSLSLLNLSPSATQLLIVEPDVPAAAALLAKAPPAAASRISLVPYPDAAPPGWWGAYLTSQAGAGAAPAVGTGHVRAWVAQADALLCDAALVAALRAWGPHAVLGDVAYLATTGLAAALGVPFATLSCTGPVDPLHADLLGLENDLRTTPQFGTGLGLPLGWEGTAVNVAAWAAGKAFFRYVWHAIWQPVACVCFGREREREKREKRKRWKDRGGGAHSHSHTSHTTHRLKHRIPLLGSPASTPQELLHLYSGDFALEWCAEEGFFFPSFFLFFSFFPSSRE